MAWLSDFFHNLFLNTEITLIAAVLLGLMASVGPCTLATNVASIAYISRRITDRKYAIMASLLYSLGRMITYTLIGLLIIAIGMETPAIRNFLEDVGTYVLGPLLILAGILMLVIDRFSFGGGGRITALGNKVSDWGLVGSFLMGVIFALAFCPYSAVLFFAVLIPMALTSTGGVFLPPLFAIGTGLPVIFFGMLIAAGVTAVSRWVNNLGKTEKILRIVMAIIFIGVGIYYLTQI
ncbi:MAG: aromatic aminobenezylarsenical efflux permease ArsG family transporter [Dehalococcoidales bacterium]|jgi:cytochrome c biogenesis protein CcdA|nr:aromatic aminobenezylarsenical efflux permease ArsG family transporter [Dehalococcoidales bacterium]MDD3264368.1 aromatic aminobenezylarsenical efflux permease ArsG family transporter [Dehalococcoidales bacterium]MDD4322134.1 aromatic aminobenezylarsenical efflux permease ArsG family transporter [Dehalococcoidales bacterium]MDD4793704.1 aromatic aminobenezylarsenical efflux permease ArsG family transporter [Dehalococcoidales bacterium]MDD5122816.1 aromatic aminobenezylarsenical efflux permea